jgi:predicted DNA-binding protein
LERSGEVIIYWREKNEPCLRQMGHEKNHELRMQNETQSRMDNLVQSIGELAGGAQKLAYEAARQYLAEVENILKAQSRDSKHIERCLDGMLDFCFDDGMLVLYKKLCRYYFDIDPKATVSYVHAYREMWDEQEPDKT